MKNVEIKMLRGDKYKVDSKLILKESYVPKDKALRLKIIWLHHSILLAEHGRKWKMMELVTRNYWWPGVMRDVGRYVKSCNSCQRMKSYTESPAGKLIAKKALEKL